MYETIEQLTCDGLTAVYVILRELTNRGKDMKTLTELNDYIEYLMHFVAVTHTEKMEDMRREFFEGRSKQ